MANTGSRLRAHCQHEDGIHASTEAASGNETVIIDIEDELTPQPSISDATPIPRRYSCQLLCQLHHATIVVTNPRLYESQDHVQYALPPCIDSRSSGQADPFNSLPGGLYDETLLVHHYNTQFINTFTAPGPRKHWFPIALIDPAFYHSAMMISAGNIAGLQGRPAPPSFWYHRGEAIRQINDRLGQIDLAARDYSIATIAVLGIADCLEVNKTGIRAHWVALQRLISARGGLDEIDMTIQKLLGWIDLLSSMVLVEPPVLSPARFVTVNYHTYYGTPSLSSTFHATGLKARLLHFTCQPEPCNNAARIYLGLRNLSILKATANSTDSTSSRGLQFSDRCELLEREVQQLLHSSLRESSLEDDNHSLIFTLFARASLLYIYSALRDLLMNIKMFQEVGNLLEESMDMEDYHLNLFLGTFPDLMLWVLFLGGSVVGLSQKVWFAKMAARILRICKIEDAKIMCTATAFLWPEGRQNYDGSESVDLRGPEFGTPEIPLLFEPIPKLVARPGNSCYK